nr:hypothetical protein [Tanacetum cinerariifolium]
MSTNEQTPLSQPTSAVRNTLGKEQAPQNLVRPVSDEDLREYYDKNYHQILPIIPEKLHQEKAQQEKLKVVKARLNFEEASRYSESETTSRRRNLKERLGPRLGDKEKNVFAHSRGSERKSYYSSRNDTESCYQSSRSKETEITSEKHHHKREYSRRTKAVSEKANRRNAKGRKALIFDLRIKAKPWKRPGKDSKKGGNLKERQTVGNINGGEDGTEGPMIIEAEMEGHCVHRIYMDGGSSSEICDEEHSTSAWMNFMVVRSPSPYNGIIGRPGVRKIQAIPSTANGMIKFPVAGGIVTLRSNKIIPLECSMVSEQGVPRQKKRGQAPERNKAISEEVKKLVEADIMKEVHYHSWLSNPVMVKKHDDSWRMCVDFKDLNKACPKDGYLLLEIDWKVEFLCGYPYKCFLDAYKGYHQIKMAEEDEEKTAFITSQGIFCYSKMPFGLKNARATYQRLVDKAFQKQIGQNLEVYVDDLVIKSRTEKEVIRDIEETFKTLREINVKLNPKKCAFGMREGTFLRYKVDVDGLRVCSDKVEAVLDLPSLKCLKDVQKLNGKLASLNRFLSKSAKKSLPFFKLKKCTKKTPREKEELIMYLAAAKEAIGAVLMTERDRKQVPIYFINRALQGPEINYTPMEKLILALASAREHDIQYRPRTSVKGQILAYFIVERLKDDTPDTSMKDREELSETWILFTDGSSCINEYEALIVGLQIARQMRVQNLQANVDSKHVANQVNGIYIAKESSMIKEKEIDEKEILVVVEEDGHTWMTLVYEYLTEGVLPEEKKKARVVRRKAGRYAVINKVLYQKSFLGPWLRCVGPLQCDNCGLSRL